MTSIRPWLVLAGVSLAVLMGMSLWFTASAVAPELQRQWRLSDAEAGWLTTTVQLGFVAGTAAAALLNVADLVASRWLFSASAASAAAVNAALLLSPSFAVALPLRFLTGFFLAGVYPPAMKMVATWFAPAGGASAARRGVAIGSVVGALTIGKALPYLLRAFPAVTFEHVILTASAAALLAGAGVGGMYHDGPYAFARRPFSWALVGTVVRHRPTRLAIGGYLGHMWELYAMWTLVALFFHDHFTARGFDSAGALSAAAAVAFAVIAAGGLGSVLAGVWADRFGRERITIFAMAVSGGCALTAGWLLAAPTIPLIVLALVWGFSIVADSAQFSSLVTELAPTHAVGTALTLQTSIGFLLTAVAIPFTIAVHARFGWGIAFTALAIGPLLGIAAMLRLKALRAAQLATD